MQVGGMVLYKVGGTCGACRISHRKGGCISGLCRISHQKGSVLADYAEYPTKKGVWLAEHAECPPLLSKRNTFSYEDNGIEERAFHIENSWASCGYTHMETHRIVGMALKMATWLNRSMLQ